MAILDRRLLGQVNQFPVSGSGGGGGSITIDNNTDGNVLTATGETNRIEGLTNFKYDGALTASTDLYISGSGNNLFINGTDATGSLKRYEIKVVGGRLVVQMDPESFLHTTYR